MGCIGFLHAMLGAWGRPVTSHLTHLFCVKPLTNCIVKKQAPSGTVQGKTATEQGWAAGAFRLKR